MSRPMPTHGLSRDEVLDRLLETFRARGYDGASLADLSAATGLGRSSLYHHFPGGKEEMAQEVLARMGRDLERDLMAPLRAPGAPAARLDAMIAVLDRFYDSGRKACLLERLCASVDRARFNRSLAATFMNWTEAIVTLCTDAGLAPAEARARAEGAVITVEGALVLAAGLGDPGVYTRALERVRAGVLAAP